MLHYELCKLKDIVLNKAYRTVVHYPAHKQDEQHHLPNTANYCRKVSSCAASN